eukprot:scaffold1172_cov144-Skeletonema_menzelii.AAC.22
MIVIPPQQQQAAISPQGGGDKKEATTITAFGLRVPTETPKKNTAKGKRVIHPSRNSSPRSQVDFDIQATTSVDEYSKLNHSHDAFEIQHKTQAMRDLDELLGDTDDDDDDEGEESIKVTFAADEEEKEGSTKSKRRRSLSEKRKSNRHSKWLFQYTSDDIDDAVEDLISPFDGITNFMTCHRCDGGDDNSLVENNDSFVEKGEMV